MKDEEYSQDVVIDGSLSYCPKCRCVEYKEKFFVRSTDYYFECSACSSLLGAGIIKYLQSTIDTHREDSKVYSESRRLLQEMKHARNSNGGAE